MRFGLNNVAEPTLAELGEKFLLTRERIQQVEAAALRKLRDPQLSPPAQLVRPSRVSDAVRVERVSLRPGPGGQAAPSPSV